MNHSQAPLSFSSPTTPSGSPVDVTQLPLYQAAQLVRKTWSAGLLVLGGFGNLCTIVIMTRIKDLQSSRAQHAILTALAVSDLCLLYVGLLSELLQFFNVHLLLCQLAVWLIFSSSTLSAWLLVCVTVQRTLAVTIPHRMRVVCTLRRTRAVIVAVVLAALALPSHFLQGLTMSDDHVCRYLDSAAYHYFALNVWPWLDMCLSSFLPTASLLVCDVILSLSLFGATLATAGTQGGSQDNSAPNQSRRKTASRTTGMILALSSSFLALTLPVCIFKIWEDYGMGGTPSEPVQQAKHELIYVVVSLLWYTNSAVNFLLYCFTGTRFRKEFLSMIHCWRNRGGQWGGEGGTDKGV